MPIFNENNKLLVTQYIIPFILFFVSVPLLVLYKTKSLFKFIMVTAIFAYLYIGLAKNNRHDTLFEIESDKVQVTVSHVYRQSPAKETLKNKGEIPYGYYFMRCALSNYCIYRELFFYTEEYPTTLIQVNAVQGGDRIFCSYEVTGFKKSNEIDYSTLKAFEISINGSDVYDPSIVQLLQNTCNKTLLSQNIQW